MTVGAAPSLIGQAPEPAAPEARPKDFRPYGERSRFSTSARVPYSANSIPHVHGWVNPLQDQAGIITPSGLHFWEDHGYVLPVQDMDPQQFRLMIHGLVERPRIYTLEELRRLDRKSVV